MGKGGSVSVSEGIVMSEDAPVNTGAVGWPDEDSATRYRGSNIPTPWTETAATGG